MAPKVSPRLVDGLEGKGCILKAIHSRDDLKEALWQTPRWGRPEWALAKTLPEFAAAVCRSLRDEEFASFLAKDALSKPGQGDTIWHRLAAAEAGLHEAQLLVAGERELRMKVELALHDAGALALGRYDELNIELARRDVAEAAYREVEALAIERLAELTAERDRRSAIATVLREVEASAAERLNEIAAEREKCAVLEHKITEAARSMFLAGERADAAESELAAASAKSLAHLANLGKLRDQMDGQKQEWQAQLMASKREFRAERDIVAGLRLSLSQEQEKTRAAIRAADDIRFSTVWRLSAPLRAVVENIPVLHAALRRCRSLARAVVRGRQR